MRLIIYTCTTRHTVYVSCIVVEYRWHSIITVCSISGKMRVPEKYYCCTTHVVQSTCNNNTFYRKPHTRSSTCCGLFCKCIIYVNYTGKVIPAYTGRTQPGTYVNTILHNRVRIYRSTPKTVLMVTTHTCNVNVCALHMRTCTAMRLHHTHIPYTLVVSWILCHAVKH